MLLPFLLTPDSCLYHAHCHGLRRSCVASWGLSSTTSENPTFTLKLCSCQFAYIWKVTSNISSAQAAPRRFQKHFYSIFFLRSNKPTFLPRLVVMNYDYRPDYGRCLDASRLPHRVHPPLLQQPWSGRLRRLRHNLSGSS